ncbi:Indoleamine 2,3-dioxygenase [Russula emetica]|nr:Indoleamine 2,3-dioxygenase [Russula emetica]
MALLPSNHFLALPRPDVLVGPPAGVVDTTTLAAHDFDVDTRTGFMPPNPPLARLPSQWEPWEQLLDEAQSYRLQLGKKINITDEEKARSESWRARVAQLPTLPTADLYQSELLLRRSHHVLAWTMHFYIHSLPTEAEIRIPAPITVPLLQICVQLQLPPVITYSDDVLYNWALKVPSTEPTPALDNLRCLTLFTGTRDEEEFYLASARIELRGVDALEIMRATMDELFVGDTLASRRITRYLQSLIRVLDDLARLLLAVRDGCDPDVFYHVIRPWFNGADSGSRKWTFEGLDDDAGMGLRVPTELSGPSAAQSSLIHAFDAFLGVDHTSPNPAHPPTTFPSSSPVTPTLTLEVRAPTTIATATVTVHVPPKPPFLTRMRAYMPRHHRNFLHHLGAVPRPLRAAVAQMGDAALTEAYNASVDALRRFREAHLRIVALYIVGPSHRGAHTSTSATTLTSPVAPRLLLGTGGTDLIRFLKGVRDRTSEATLPSGAGAP